MNRFLKNGKELSVLNAENKSFIHLSPRSRTLSFLKSHKAKLKLIPSIGWQKRKDKYRGGLKDNDKW